MPPIARRTTRTENECLMSGSHVAGSDHRSSGAAAPMVVLRALAVRARSPRLVAQTLCQGTPGRAGWCQARAFYLPAGRRRAQRGP